MVGLVSFCLSCAYCFGLCLLCICPVYAFKVFPQAVLFNSLSPSKKRKKKNLKFWDFYHVYLLSFVVKLDMCCILLCSDCEEVCEQQLNSIATWLDLYVNFIIYNVIFVSLQCLCTISEL